MKLDEECQEMLGGSQGRLVKGAMEFLVRLGEAYGADDMVDVVFGQVRVILDRWSELALPENSPAKFLSEEAFQEAIELGVRIRASGISGHEAIDFEECDVLQIDEQDQLKYRRQTELERDLGLICIRSCDPYLNVGIDAPPLGAHMVSMESSAIPYYNSVMGARLNRDGIAAFLAVLTGKYPRFGYHLDENRRPTELVKVKAKLRNHTDYGVLGLLTGERIGHKVSAFSMDEDPGPYEQVQLSSGISSGGPVAMYHILGITPEARSDSTLIPDRYDNTYEISQEDIARVYQRYSAKGEKVDFVTLGCPSHDVFWLKRIAEMLKGRTVKKGVQLWVLATSFAREAARERGFDKWITEAGGAIICGTCPLKSAGIPGPAHAHKNPDYSIGNLATDSIRMAHDSGLVLRAKKLLFGEPERCIDAAVSGNWR
jgi:predicted aconitase